MKTLKYIAILATFFLISSASARNIEIRIMQTSDIHGNFYPYDFITGHGSDGSLARVATAVTEARENGKMPLILLDNGDILQGQPTAYYYNYVDTASRHLAAEMLNFIGYDAATVGNHDMETGTKVLKRYASDCAMPVLGANIIDKRTGNPAFQPYKIINHDGIRIAVLGLITPAIPAWLPETLWEGLRFDDMEETAQKWLPIIKQHHNPHAIIGLFHSGQSGNILAGHKENASVEVAKNVPGFDIVMMGHDHRRENRKIANISRDSVLIINPANNANTIASVIMTFNVNEHGNVTGKTLKGNLLDMSGYKPDSAFVKKFATQKETVKNYVSQPIGTINKTISTREAFFGPSEFVDLIHTLQLAITGADISMAAPLSYDANIPAGTITMADMFSLYKYENLLYVMELKGKEIKGYLEESYGKWTNQMKSPNDNLLLFKQKVQSGDKSRSTLLYPSYNFDSAAGIIYEVDVTKPKGSRVTIKSMADGSAFNPEKTYRVALNSYRGNGGGELLTNGAGIEHSRLKERIVYSTDRDLRHYLAEYISAQKEITPKKLNHWKFVPEKWVVPASERDIRLLFNR